MSRNRIEITRKAWASLVLCLCFTTAVAQEKERESSDKIEVKEVLIVKPQDGPPPVPVIGFIPAVEPQADSHAQVMPQFPGGEESLKGYLKHTLRYPERARKKGVQGAVLVQFDVDLDGELKDIKIVKDIGSGCGDEAIRLVRKMPPWLPGKQNGKVVKANYTLKIDFVLAQ